MAMWQTILSSAALGGPTLASLRPATRPFTVLSAVVDEGLSQGEGPAGSGAAGGTEEEGVPSFLLVNNFFDYAIHRDPSLLRFSAESTGHWVDMLSQALTKSNVPLVAAINAYHGLGHLECGTGAAGGGAGGSGDVDSEDSDAEEGQGAGTGCGSGPGSKAGIGSRDVVNTILEDAVMQTRGLLSRQSTGTAAEGAARWLPQQQQQQESKRPRLQACSSALKRSTGVGVPSPSVADTVDLITYLCSPLVLSAIAEHCIACLASTGSTNESTSGSDSSSSSAEQSLNGVLRLLAVLLVHSPAGATVAGPANRSSMASQVLNVFAFGRSSQMLTEGLWRRVATCVQANPGTCVQKLVPDNSSSLGKAVPLSRGLFSPVSTAASVAASSSAGGSVASSGEDASSLLVLLCILSHQLLAMDDEEFMGGGKALQMSDICELVHLLKTLLFHMYWTCPVLTTHESLFAEEEGEGDPRHRSQFCSSLRIHLTSVQLLFISTKVFNQLSVRNERIHFLPPSGWLWTSLGSSELEGLDVEADPFLDQRKTRARMVLLLCPQVIPFSQRAVYFQKLIQNDKKKVKQHSKEVDINF
jgi:hypothetical protein